MAYLPNALNYPSSIPNPYDVEDSGTMASVQMQAQKASDAQKAYQTQQYTGQVSGRLPGLINTGTLSGYACSDKAKSSRQANVLGNSLQDEAANVRTQADQLKSRLSALEYLLFEPVPSSTGQSGDELKDNPSTIEGNVQYTSRSLGSALLTIDRIISKIGGR